MQLAFGIDVFIMHWMIRASRKQDDVRQDCQDKTAKRKQGLNLCKKIAKTKNLIIQKTWSAHTMR